MNAWDVKLDINNVLCALEMTQHCSATVLSVSHFLPCLVRKEVLYMKTVRNNNTEQTLWENLCTRSVVPISFFFFASLSRIQLSELNVHGSVHRNFFFALRPNASHGFLILVVFSRSHTMTHDSR